MAGLEDLHRVSVDPRWVDFNGHMRDGYYAVAFSEGIDAFMEHIGMNEAFRGQTGHTIYTLEMHLTYQQEAFKGQLMSGDFLLLDRDAKRVHTFQTLTLVETGEVLATMESMLANVDQSGAAPKIVPFHENLEPTVDRIWQTHRPTERPKFAGRTIGIRRKP